MNRSIQIATFSQPDTHNTLAQLRRLVHDSGKGGFDKHVNDYSIVRFVASSAEYIKNKNHHLTCAMGLRVWARRVCQAGGHRLGAMGCLWGCGVVSLGTLGIAVAYSSAGQT